LRYDIFKREREKEFFFSLIYILIYKNILFLKDQYKMDINILNGENEEN
jgi:hypothetical protein